MILIKYDTGVAHKNPQVLVQTHPVFLRFPAWETVSCELKAYKQMYVTFKLHEIFDFVDILVLSHP